MVIKNPYRIILLLVISFLLLKNLFLIILLGDISSIIPAILHLLLLFLIKGNHPLTMTFIYAWAILYLITYTGVKAGGKTLVILAGNGQEIDPLFYSIDIGLLVIGLTVLLFGKKMSNPKYEE